MVELRADAQRNLGRVLDAAAEVFAERGPDASVDEIARRAGVGHGTVFRRFPTKESLVAAVMCRRLEEITAAAEDLLEQPDAGEAFERFIWEIGERFALVAKALPHRDASERRAVGEQHVLRLEPLEPAGLVERHARQRRHQR